MAMKYHATDYMYGSARVRALEGKLVSRERLEHMLEAKSTADVLAMLPDYGFTVVTDRDDGTGEPVREDSLLSVLVNGYEELDTMSEESASLIRFLRYPYDCNNIKALIKCFSREIEPDGMLFDRLGTVALETLKDAFQDKNYASLPKHMADAAREAEEAFSATGNPQKVDLILDRACFADMLDAAKASGSPFAVRLVEEKIDLTNLITCIRLIRMQGGLAAEAFLEEALLPGGTLDGDLLRSALTAGEEFLAEGLRFTRFSFVSDLLIDHAPLHVLELAAEDCWMDLAREGKFVPFGAEVLIGYAVALEYQVKNIRILLAGKDAGLAPDVIRERLRRSYV